MYHWNGGLLLKQFFSMWKECYGHLNSGYIIESNEYGFAQSLAKYKKGKQVFSIFLKKIYKNLKLHTCYA